MSSATDIQCLRSLLLVLYPFLRPATPDLPRRTIEDEMGDELLPKHAAMVAPDAGRIIAPQSSAVH